MLLLQDLHLNFTNSNDSNIAHLRLYLAGIVENVRLKIPMVWPLQDYVAVNPLSGFAKMPLWNANRTLRAISAIDMSLPLCHFRQQWKMGAFDHSDVTQAANELQVLSSGVYQFTSKELLAVLRNEQELHVSRDSKCDASPHPARILWTVAERLDSQQNSCWHDTVTKLVSNHCAAHYDDGQAMWTYPWSNLNLYQAWIMNMRHDRTSSAVGIKHLRELVRELPHDAIPAIAFLLRRLNVPPSLWESFLLCQALSICGWSAWVNYQQKAAEEDGFESPDFAGLLAIRLTYDVALKEQFEIPFDWETVEQSLLDIANCDMMDRASLLNNIFLRVTEIGYRRKLVRVLSNKASHEQKIADRKLAQMVFCIDVRSERIRRQIEQQSVEVQTYGFAGFFGMPVLYAPLGEVHGRRQVPAILTPSMQANERVKAGEQAESDRIVGRLRARSYLLKSFKEFKESAASAFTFVEASGLAFAWKLLVKTVGPLVGQNRTRQRCGASPCQSSHPTFSDTTMDGAASESQVELAIGFLRGVGIVDDFARLVVICGHESKTVNNPLQASLDCGACGGHSGAVNARLATSLLNNSRVRIALHERGITIPAETWFVAGVHNTTTDALEFFDLDHVPASHRGDLIELQHLCSLAAAKARQERLPALQTDVPNEPFRRSQDWSEVRPEWGLAGNAALIIAKRELTMHADLDGRTFLHSYDASKDADGAVLKQIIAGPVVVAHWINMQYFASSTDHLHFGCGNKTLHNVVGRFGILEGSGGDLRIGLPWQSVHNGRVLQHSPQRLLVVIEAAPATVASIVNSNQYIADCTTNGWLEIVVHHDDQWLRYTNENHWEIL